MTALVTSLFKEKKMLKRIPLNFCWDNQEYVIPGFQVEGGEAIITLRNSKKKIQSFRITWNTERDKPAPEFIEINKAQVRKMKLRNVPIYSAEKVE